MAALRLLGIFDVQDTVVKQNLIRTIDLIGKALHPDHLKTNEFIFSKRGDLINHLLVSFLGYYLLL
jgi:hypothetical protein